MVKIEIGRHLFGAAAILFGAVALAWHDFNAWHQLRTLWNTPYGPAIGSVATVAEIVGGTAIQSRRTARAGSAILGIAYLYFAFSWVPRIVAHPTVYDDYGSFFEQFSLVCGAAIVFDRRLASFARIGLGICVVSFALEQLFYLQATAHFVPAWIPPNQMFWAVTTTIAFALAAIAILTNQQASLAARLLTLMIVLFGALIWVPAMVKHPQQHINWGGVAENFLIAGATWILADSLSASTRGGGRSRW